MNQSTRLYNGLQILPTVILIGTLLSVVFGDRCLLASTPYCVEVTSFEPSSSICHFDMPPCAVFQPHEQGTVDCILSEPHPRYKVTVFQNDTTGECIERSGVRLYHRDVSHITTTVQAQCEDTLRKVTEVGNHVNVEVICPSGCLQYSSSSSASSASSRVWGTGIYLKDSLLCAAGIHAGLISAARGGTMIATVVSANGLVYYGSASHQVVSRDHLAPVEGAAVLLT